MQWPVTLSLWYHAFCHIPDFFFTLQYYVIFYFVRHTEFLYYVACFKNDNDSIFIVYLNHKTDFFFFIQIFIIFCINCICRKQVDREKERYSLRETENNKVLYIFTFFKTSFWFFFIQRNTFKSPLLLITSNILPSNEKIKNSIFLTSFMILL